MPIDLALEPLNERVVEAIRLEMARLRVTQTSLGIVLGHNQAYVSARLTGKTELKLSEVEDIAHALGVPVEQLLTAESRFAPRRRRAGLWLS